MMLRTTNIKLIYTSSSPSPIAFCQWPVDGCPASTAVLFHHGKVKYFIRMVRNIIFLWLGKPRHIWHLKLSFAGELATALWNIKLGWMGSLVVENFRYLTSVAKGVKLHAAMEEWQ